MASFSVVTNIASVNAQANLSNTTLGLQKALNRLSSGFRINTAGDDATGLSVANAYRNDIAMVNQGIRNANDGLSNLQIKDGALTNISALLDRLATLSSQASSGSTTDASRVTLNTEFQDVLTEITREATVASLTTRQRVLGLCQVERQGHQHHRGHHHLDPDAGWSRDHEPGPRRIRGRGGRLRGDGTRHTTGHRRHAPEPAPVRDLVSPEPGCQQHRGGKPDSGCQHRRGIRKPDPVQHPESERYRGARTGQPDHLIGTRAATVTFVLGQDRPLPVLPASSNHAPGR